MAVTSVKQLQPSSREEWLSTYTALTASGILERLGAKLDDKLISSQLHEPRSFYRKLVRMPAMNAFNELIRNQCRDIQAFAQQQLIEYLFSGEADKADTEPGLVLREKIEQDRLALMDTSDKLTALEQQHTRSIEDTNTLLREEVVKWHNLIDELTEQTWQLLQQHGIQLAAKFKPRLRELFDLQAARVEVPKEVLQGLKIKTTPSPWTKALIKFLSEVAKNE